MRPSKNSVIKYQNKLSLRGLKNDKCLLIFDKKLIQYPEARKVIKKFPLRYGVQGGETLKDLKKFPAHVEKILKILHKNNQKDLTIIGFGGGSIGDFSGFFASTFKRGVHLVFIPSTWLSAIDSSHGGKNGLNVALFKNQIGTFYMAQTIYIARNILKHQPQPMMIDAAGELFKMALIEGGKLWRQFQKLQYLNEKQLWDILPLAIRAKYQIVQEDPTESNGYRQTLNLGHTLGHVIEARLGVSHGAAVGQGLVFATEWSYKMGFLGTNQYQLISKNLFYKHFYLSLRSSLADLDRKKIEISLMMDKKKSQKNDLYFIFPVRPGLCIRHNVKIKNILQATDALKKKNYL